MNPFIDSLHPYPFQKLAELLEGLQPNPDKTLIKLTIGEPQHQAPQVALDALADNLNGVSKYPSTKGELALRQSITEWTKTRFKLNSLNPDTQVLPVTGTREALFAITQTLVGEKPSPLVISPNPFYQIYEGAAILAGANRHFLPCDANNQYKIDYQAVTDNIWQNCEILFVCSPNNPSGTVTTLEEYAFLIEKAKQFNFTIVADECYSEIYFGEDAPLGLLEACQILGHLDYQHCLIFQSLSKRSNLPGLRSGFVAGDASLLKPFLLYRTYQGCAMPIHHQQASIAAWNDERHVMENRQIYTRKFDAVLDILEPVMQVSKPEAGFYLWPQLTMSDEEFCTALYQEEAVLVLPGSYLGREVNGHNPGSQHARMALVAEESECTEAAHRIKAFLSRR
ncbi:succinyldiaminopimelate transaminase [Marinomonas posidonica]|uniref:Succinyldiaminopimelate transaminase n=1 Tax=Marinomonas posidonica (strain CECT 7376 / NCIMB 14433 / IVIA-Po-181) TaxID=491952 RepID=F6CY32_MARPP|nr:succinyldiaminopimelate transaminase [Marinomonas posidonica]AEF55664.1 succinyldiaminopimelate transaminase [Marinomonas posidonica IVIA-Po-181]